MILSANIWAEDELDKEKKVLVVDDEAAIREVVTQAFERAEYRVFTAESAEKAIDILRQESIMVMFLDLKLPGMNGLELCELVRRQNPLAIIYALTGFADLFGLLDCRKAGFDDFFDRGNDIVHIIAGKLCRERKWKSPLGEECRVRETGFFEFKSFSVKGMQMDWNEMNPGPYIQLVKFVLETVAADFEGV